MSYIGRKLPKSNIACQKALNTAVAKAAISTTILSDVTTERLNTDNTNFNAAITLVINTKQAQRAASAATDVAKAKFNVFFSSYFSTLNNAIAIEQMPRSVRAYYNIDINNDRHPVIKTDAEILLCGQLVIDGDAKRVLAGGIAMAFPTIAQYTVVFNACKAAIATFSASKLTVLEAESARNSLKTEVKNVILRAWNEIETHYSELEASAKRAACRLFGVKYVSQGSPAFVTGIITNSVTGLPIPKAILHLEGVGTKFIADINGKYTIKTNQNGDLTILANLPGYTESETDILLIDGGNMEVNIKMVEIIK